MLGSLMLVLGLQVLVVHLPLLQGLFDTVALEPQHGAAAAGAASLAVVTGELDKAVRRLRERRGHHLKEGL